jgi:hypothetical protein
MSDHRDQILAFAKKGPILPMQVAKLLGVDSIMASAMLSELVSKNLLKVSGLKVGSSPLYYDPTTPAMLENFVKNLNQKEQRAVEELKKRVVMREKDLDPLTRVCLRNARDFALPLEVQFQGSSELFWKYFTVSDEDAELKIKEYLTPPEPPKPSPPPEPAPKPEPAPPTPKPVPPEPAPALKVKKVVKKKTVKKKDVQKPLTEPKKKYSVTDEFTQKLEEFFEENKIEVTERLESRKNDFSFLVEVPSAVGSVTHYCRARKKAKISDADIGQAFLHGQIQKLPVLFIGEGELAKKTEEIIQDIKGLSVKFL